MIRYQQIDPSYFPLYDQLPMQLMVTSEYEVQPVADGLAGLRLTEKPVRPYIKNFLVGDEATVTNWQRFDLTNWGFFMAFRDDQPVGAATIAARTPGVHMLAHRNDLAVLWDIRVAPPVQRQGVGHHLFELACAWSRQQGLTQLKIECQTNNVSAIKFYHQQGAVLGGIDRYAYAADPALRHETQLLWYLPLVK